MEFLKIILWWLAAVNAWAFLAVWSDKHRAVLGRRRIRERTLFLLAAAGGCPGLYLAMLLFRHKTRHLSFMLGIPMIFLCQTAAVYFLFVR